MIYHELSDGVSLDLAPCSFSVLVIIFKPGLPRPAHFESEFLLFPPRALLHLQSTHHARDVCSRLESSASLLCAPLTP